MTSIDAKEQEVRKQSTRPCRTPDMISNMALDV